MLSSKFRYSELIKQEAAKLGFLSCGIAQATFLEDEAPRLEKWLNQGMHGEMHYMENHFDKRLDPRLLVNGAKSVISLTYNYYSDKKQEDTSAPKISKYAYGKDYHYVIKDKLNQLLTTMQEEIGEIGGRAFVDSAPILERAWAHRTGLGWIGKNTNLISKKQGSYFFLCELIVDIELAYDQPIAKDYCGSCTKCIDACPTEAIVGPNIVDGSKCISYLTIELKNEIPKQFEGKTDNWMFGCDICQDVCPWNRFSSPNNESAFQPSEELLKMTKSEWQEITEETFKKVFSKSAVKRAKYRGLTRNINFLKSNTSDPS